MKQKEVDGHIVTSGIMSGTPVVSIEKKSYASAPQIRFDMLDNGDGTIRVYNGDGLDDYIDLSINAIRVGLDMLEDKGADTPAEAESGVVPNVLEIRDKCPFRILLECKKRAACVAKGAVAAPTCHAMTLDDLSNCAKQYNISVLKTELAKLGK